MIMVLLCQAVAVHSKGKSFNALKPFGVTQKGTSISTSVHEITSPSLAASLECRGGGITEPRVSLLNMATKKRLVYKNWAATTRNDQDDKQSNRFKLEVYDKKNDETTGRHPNGIPKTILIRTDQHPQSLLDTDLKFTGSWHDGTKTNDRKRHWVPHFFVDDFIEGSPDDDNDNGRYVVSMAFSSRNNPHIFLGADLDNPGRVILVDTSQDPDTIPNNCRWEVIFNNTFWAWGKGTVGIVAGGVGAVALVAATGGLAAAALPGITGVSGIWLAPSTVALEIGKGAALYLGPKLGLGGIAWTLLESNVSDNLQQYFV